LLQERRRFEQWLATLESRRAITPPNVYGRVHADYTARLSAVLDELGGRSAELQQSVENLTGRVAALQNEESTRRDERYEAELRAAVGEYTQEKWLQISESADGELARLGAQRTELTAELAQVQQLLAQAKARQPVTAAPVAVPVAPPPPPTAPSAPPQAVKMPPLAPMAPATLPAAAPPAPTTASGPAPAPASSAASGLGGGQFADIASVTPVPGPKVIPPPPPATLPFAAPGGAPRGNAPRPAEPKTAEGAARRPAAPPAGGTAAPPAKKGDQSMFDELEFLKSVVDPKTEAKGAQADAPAPASASSAAPPAAPARKLATPPEAGTLNDIAVGGDRPRPKGTAGDGVPVFLRDVPTEQVKTLKCQECGSMNYPTEWYCERCGGELAAM
jgi:hypothetical protein